MNKPLRKKGGRSRNGMAPREHSGRIDRRWAADQRQKAAMETALEARQRIFGLSETQARDPLAGSTIGRMVLHGELSRDQGQMAVKYSEVINAYQRAICAPTGINEPRPDTSGGGDYEAFCERAKSRYDGMMMALRDLSMEQRSAVVFKALDQFITQDNHIPMLVGDLRIGLNRLHRHFVDGQNRKRA